jgi:hypothetical protein
VITGGVVLALAAAFLAWGMAAHNLAGYPYAKALVPLSPIFSFVGLAAMIHLLTGPYRYYYYYY